MHAWPSLTATKSLVFFCNAYLGDGELDGVAMVMIKMGGIALFDCCMVLEINEVRRTNHYTMVSK